MKECENFRTIQSHITREYLLSLHQKSTPTCTYIPRSPPLLMFPLPPAPPPNQTGKHTHKHTRSSSPLKQRNIHSRLANNRTRLGNSGNPLSAAFLGIINKLPQRCLFFYVPQTLATGTSRAPPRFQSAFFFIRSLNALDIRNCKSGK